MNHLHQIRVSTTPLDHGFEQTHIDLFTLDGCHVSVFARTAEVGPVLTATDCNLLRLVIDDDPQSLLALVAGWPHPWRAARLSLNEVIPDEEITLFLRVAPPAGSPSERWDRAEELPWIRVQGPRRPPVNRSKRRPCPPAKGRSAPGTSRCHEA